MSIPFLSLKDVTALHGAELNEAVSHVINGDMYFMRQGKCKIEVNCASCLLTRN